MEGKSESSRSFCVIAPMQVGYFWFVIADFSAFMERLLCIYGYLGVSEDKYCALLSNSSYFTGVVIYTQNTHHHLVCHHGLGTTGTVARPQGRFYVLEIFSCWSAYMCLVIFVSYYIIFNKFNLSVSILRI